MGIESLIKREKLEEMEIGDYISCRYTSLTSGQVGVFSELGTTTIPEIPITGSATPDGKFNFIKVDKGLLIADRVIQHSISWDVLNSNRFIEGELIGYNKIGIDLIKSANYNGINLLTSQVLINENNENGPYDGSTVSATLIIEFKQPNTEIELIKIKAYTSYYNISYSIDGTNFIRLVLNNSGIMKTENISIQLPKGVEIKYLKCDVCGTTITKIPTVYSMIMYTNKVLVRSLSGGVAYADINDNKSLADCGKGAWPINNEWDKYIVNSDLGGKITPGDDNIWHWSNPTFSKTLSWCRDTPYNYNTNRMVRGFTNIDISCDSMNKLSWMGFRPVLEYIEQDSKQTTLWY